MVRVGDLCEFKSANHPSGKQVGIVLEIIGYDDPRVEQCAALTQDGISYFFTHNSCLKLVQSSGV